MTTRLYGGGGGKPSKLQQKTNETSDHGRKPGKLQQKDC